MDCTQHGRRARESGLAAARGLALVVLTSLLSACGGGALPSEATVAASGTGASSLSTAPALCQNPRHGIDPVTHTAYPDKQGTLLDEQGWLSAWASDTYLWYAELPSGNPAGYSTATAWFDVLKTTATTPSGRAKDRFHFSYTTAYWESLETSGASAGYGLAWDLVAASPPRVLYVAYLEPALPASTSAAALSRGARVLAIDGAQVDYGDPNILNAGLLPAAAGEQHVFVVQDPGSSTTRSVTLTSATVTEAPVMNTAILSGSTVGYLQFNDHLAPAEAALVGAITQLKNGGATDLVLDMRYNGGGLLDIASELAYMIAGPTSTSGRTFELMQFNAKHPTTDPVTLATIVPTPFHATTLGYSLPTGQALPYLGLGRVFVLTGAGTCSASESVINSLRGVGVQVIQIGSTTCGKPYGFYPTDNCGTTYFSIQFQGVNALGFGNYPDGFVPQNGATGGIDAQAVLPGCSVGDDFSHALGDSAEARLAAALQYRGNGSCPMPSGIAPQVASAALPVAGTGLTIKHPFLQNRIVLH